MTVLYAEEEARPAILLAGGPRLIRREKEGARASAEPATQEPKAQESPQSAIGAGGFPSHRVCGRSLSRRSSQSQSAEASRLPRAHCCGVARREIARGTPRRSGATLTTIPADAGGSASGYSARTRTAQRLPRRAGPGPEALRAAQGQRQRPSPPCAGATLAILLLQSGAAPAATPPRAGAGRAATSPDLEQLSGTRRQRRRRAHGPLPSPSRRSGASRCSRGSAGTGRKPPRASHLAADPP